MMGSGARARLRVLVVDDEPELLEVLADEIELAGYDVARASGGQEAVTIARSVHVDAVLCDLKMPGIDGVETLALLRELNPELRGVLMTGFTSGEVAASLDARGFEQIEKPFGIEEVLAALERALTRSSRTPEA